MGVSRNYVCLIVLAAVSWSTPAVGAFLDADDQANSQAQVLEAVKTHRARVLAYRDEMYTTPFGHKVKTLLSQLDGLSDEEARARVGICEKTTTLKNGLQKRVLVDALTGRLLGGGEILGRTSMLFDSEYRRLIVQYPETYRSSLQTLREINTRYSDLNPDVELMKLPEPSTLPTPPKAS